jgi:hypothetical protein
MVVKEMTVDGQKFVSISEAAKLMGTTETTIRRYCKGGKLLFFKHPISKVYWIAKESIDQILQQMLDQLKSQT